MGMLAKIRRMYFRDKVPLREIARQTGLSRNTLRHWLRQLQRWLLPLVGLMLVLSLVQHYL